MNNRHLTTAIEAARAAGAVIKKHFCGTVIIEEKSDGSFVSMVDRGAERAALGVIEGQFPVHSIVTEEAGVFDRDPDSIWYIDPLDGTTNFLHHVPFFCVSIGYAHKGVLEAGVIFDPVHEELFCAERGGGAFLNGKKIEVSNPEFKNAVIGACRSSEIAKKKLGLKMAQALEERVHGVKFMGSAALELAYTSCGRFDGFVGLAVNSYDVSAGVLICEEAGAETVTHSGKPATFLDKDFVIGNKEITLQIVKYIKKAKV